MSHAFCLCRNSYSEAFRKCFASSREDSVIKAQASACSVGLTFFEGRPVGPNLVDEHDAWFDLLRITEERSRRHACCRGRPHNPEPRLTQRPSLYPDGGRMGPRLARSMHIEIPTHVVKVGYEARVVDADGRHFERSLAPRSSRDLNLKGTHSNQE